jgi:hypothetical protein
VSVSGSTQSATYNFAGVSSGTTGNCAVVADNFAAGQLTGTNMQMSGNYPPAGLQICDLGSKLYEYAVTFSNMQATWCTTPLTVSSGELPLLLVVLLFEYGLGGLGMVCAWIGSQMASTALAVMCSNKLLVCQVQTSSCSAITLMGHTVLC